MFFSGEDGEGGVRVTGATPAVFRMNLGEFCIGTSEEGAFKWNF